jgi:hypothetical protein
LQVSRTASIVLNFDEDVSLVGDINLVDKGTKFGILDSRTLDSASDGVSISGSTITIDLSGTPGNQSQLEYAEDYEITWNVGAITDSHGNQIAVLNSGDLNFKTFDLEASLTKTSDISAADQISSATFPTTDSFIIAVDIDIPTSPTGLIFECGGSGRGQFVGFNSTDSVFRARGGYGGQSVGAVDNVTTAYVDTNIGNVPSGRHTLTVEYDFPGRAVRSWIDGVLLTVDGSASGVSIADWSGGDNCAFAATTTSNITNGETRTIFNGSFESDLRFYDSQKF